MRRTVPFWNWMIVFTSGAMSGAGCAHRPDVMLRFFYIGLLSFIIATLIDIGERAKASKGVAR